MDKYKIDEELDIYSKGCVVLKQGRLQKSLGREVLWYGEDEDFHFLHRTGHLLRLVSPEKDLWFSFDSVEFIEVFV